MTQFMDCLVKASKQKQYWDFVCSITTLSLPPSSTARLSTFSVCAFEFVIVAIIHWVSMAPCDLITGVHCSRNFWNSVTYKSSSSRPSLVYSGHGLSKQKSLLATIPSRINQTCDLSHPTASHQARLFVTFQFSPGCRPDFKIIIVRGLYTA